jgi:Ca2+-transporting ATPase
MGAVSLLMGYLDWRVGDPAWQTMIFTTLTLSQLGLALAMRSTRDSLFQIGIFSNRAMIGAVGLTFLFQLALIYVPFLRELFELEPLSATNLAISVAAATIVFWAVELEKWVRRRSNA